MELELIRREYSGLHADAIVESERLAQFEVMDGSPVKGYIKLRYISLLPVQENRFQFDYISVQ